MELTIIIPAYNEGDRVYHNLFEVADTAAQVCASWEIVLVDDGSRDATHAEATKAQATLPQLRVLSYPTNRGKGFALRHGAEQARGDLIVFLDADLELPPQQIPVLLAILERESADVVAGSKRHPASRVPAPARAFPLLRRIMSAGYFVMAKLMFRLPVRDTQAGLKLFRRKVLANVLPTVRTAGFVFDLELLVQAHRAGYRIVEAPVIVRFLRSTSRLTVGDAWRMWADTVKLYSRTRLRLCRPRCARPEGKRNPAGAAGVDPRL